MFIPLFPSCISVALAVACWHVHFLFYYMVSCYCFAFPPASYVWLVASYFPQVFPLCPVPLLYLVCVTLCSASHSPSLTVCSACALVSSFSQFSFCIYSCSNKAGFELRSVFESAFWSSNPACPPVHTEIHDRGSHLTTLTLTQVSLTTGGKAGIPFCQHQALPFVLMAESLFFSATVCVFVLELKSHRNCFNPQSPRKP